MRRFLLLFFFVFSIGLISATEIYENKTVSKIDVILKSDDPSISFDPNTVLQKLKTRVGDPFSQSTFDGDLKEISNDFDKVLPELKVQNEHLQITLYLWPKPKISGISWHGNSQFSTSKLQKELGIKPGDLFTRHEFLKKLNKVKELYLKKGYFESQIAYKTSPKEKKNEVSIDINIKEGKSGNIKAIQFFGFTKKEKQDLLNMMYTKKYNFLISWLTGSGIFKEEAMEQDQMTILNYLQNKGYADAKVKIEIAEDLKTKKIILKIKADKGTLYHFGKITFIGNKIIPDNEIMAAFTIHPESIYSPEAIRQTAQNIKDVYGRKGYIEAQINFDAHLQGTEPIYLVNFTIEEGELYKIGLIKIFGNQQTKSNVILRESLLVPGELFDSRKLRATQERLQNIGYFKNVNVFAVKSQDSAALGDNYRDVYIEVEETSTGAATLSLGISSMENVYGGLQISESNFNIAGIPRLFKDGPSTLRGAGEYFQANVNIGARQRNYSIQWMDPYFRDSLWRFGFEASVTQSELQSKRFKVDTYGFSLFASHPLTEFWSFGTRYRLRDAKQHIKKSAGEEAVEEAKGSGVVSGIALSLTYDSTDNPIKPHRGIKSIMEVEGTGLGGKYKFIKLNYINSLYQKLWAKGTMKYRADLRFIQPLFGHASDYDRVPFSERFFLGGETTVRGYRPASLGPHFKEWQNGVYKDTKDPKGGLSSTLLSIEYQQEIVRVADIFFFADAGSVTTKKFYIPKLRASTGVGLRLELMNRMPFIFGWAYPINPQRHSDRHNFFFSWGGQF